MIAMGYLGDTNGIFVFGFIHGDFNDGNVSFGSPSLIKNVEEIACGLRGFSRNHIM